MDRRACFGVLAGFLLISVALGVHDAAAAGRLRILMAEKEGERSKSGQEAGSLTPPTPPVEVGRLSPGSVRKNSSPPGNPPNSPPPSHGPPNPLAAPQKASPVTPVSGSSSNPAPRSSNLSVPVSDKPSHPPPAPGGPVNPSPSASGKPLNGSPPPGVPSQTPPASDGRSSPPPALGGHPAPADAKLPNPVQSERGGETPAKGKDGKKKEKKKQSGNSSGLDDSEGKGQENDKCNASMPRCKAEGMVACLQKAQNGSHKWFLLVQNEGETPLSVNILAPSSVKIDNKLSVPQHNRSKIGFHMDAAEGLHIVLNARHKNCVIDIPQPSSFAKSLFQQLPNYANHVTPIYGVCFASLTVIFVGGTWACCKLRKRRRVDGGIAYQQLEMGMQQQSSASVDENAMNGWDEGWDDDWDEEEAAPRPPEKQGSASENGVTFRSSDKNDWEDWDD